jgi:hypothetical protein
VALLPVLATVVLWHFRWIASAVDDRWFAEEQRGRYDVGLPPY